MSDVRQPSEEEREISGEMGSDESHLLEARESIPEDVSSTPSDKPSELPPTVHRRRRHAPSVFWPLVFVGAGVLLVLSNLGYLPWPSWTVLWRLWPLLLVAIGIDLLIGRRSTGGTIVSALLILLLIGGAVAVSFFAQNFPAWVEVSKPGEYQIEHIEYPLAGLERASVTIDWTDVPGYLSALQDSANLMEGDVAHRGRLIFDVNRRGDRVDVRLDRHSTNPWFWSWIPDSGDWRERRWDIGVSPRVVLDLDLDIDSGPCDFDLTDLQVSSLVLDAGSGPLDLILPSDSTFEAQLDGGSGPINITLPEGVGARVELDSGSGPFLPDGRFQLIEGRRRDDGVWETEGFLTAEHTILLIIDQGSGPVRIR